MVHVQRKTLLIGVFYLTLLSCLLFLNSNFLSAESMPSQCRNGVEVIYARGSGQKVNDSESRSIQDHLKKYLPTGSYTFTELEKNILNENVLDYRADGVIKENFNIGLEASFVGGSIGKYADSVKDGKNLLNKYISHQNDKSVINCFVLVGYSQGAQVVGDALKEPESLNFRNNTLYVGLLGDPKLDTNGYIKFGSLPGSIIPWYRGTVVPLLQNGWLDPRRPEYLPRVNDSTFTDSGSWCYSDDMVCSSNFFKGSEGHGKYVERAIPEMTREIANAISMRTTNTPAQKPSCGALKQDIVLAINMSPTVRTDSEFLSDKGIEKTVKGVFESGCDVRVAMVEFGRKGLDPTRPVFDFTDDPAVLTNELKSYRTDFEPAFQIEKADVTGAISLAMDFQWNEGAQKAVVVMSDAPDDNFVRNGSGDFDGQASLKKPEMQDILRKSSEKGGVEIHAVRIYHNDRQDFILDGPTSFYTYMRELVTRTAGSFTDKGSCNYCSWQNMSFDLQSKLAQKPNVSVQTIRIKKGQSIELTAKDVSGGVIPQNNKPSYPMSYTWYTDCQSLGSPTGDGMSTNVTPTEIGTCYGAVLARGSSPAFCNICFEGDPYSVRAVTPFLIEVLPADYQPPPVPSVVRNITKERLWDDNTIRIKWDPPGNADQIGEIAYIIRDSDGSVLGATRSTRLHIIDVADTDNPIVTVNAVSDSGSGESVSIISALDLSPPQPKDSIVQPGPISNGNATSPPTGSILTPPALVPGNTSGIITVATQQLSTADNQQKVLSAISPSYNRSAVVDVHKPNPQSSSWLSLTILAVPIAVALALGLVVKYGMMLRLSNK